MVQARGQAALREHAERLGIDHEVEEPEKVRVGLGLAAPLLAEDLWPVVDTAEDVGMDSLWFAERLAGDQLSPIAAMAAVAARTTRLRFGSSATILPGRDPVRLAKDLATIDVLSRGRLIPVLGLVAPHSGDRELLRVPQGAAGRWADEALSVLRRLWAGETIDHEGEFFQYRGLRVGPRTADSPHMDVWTAGHSAAAIERAGRFADGWLPSFLPPDHYAPLARQVLEAAGRAGGPGTSATSAWWCPTSLPDARTRPPRCSSGSAAACPPSSATRSWCANRPTCSPGSSATWRPGRRSSWRCRWPARPAGRRRSPGSRRPWPAPCANGGPEGCDASPWSGPPAVAAWTCDGSRDGAP
jgi:probable F420-dependent oxidoreductase